MGHLRKILWSCVGYYYVHDGLWSVNSIQMLLIKMTITDCTDYYQFSICNFCAFSSHRVMKSIDATLHLFEIFGLQAMEPGILVVEFIFSIVWQLLDASLDDEGLLELTEERVSRWAIKPQEMEIDGHDIYDEKKIEYHEWLRNFNTTMAIEIIGQFLQNKVTSRILYLARRNMYVFCKLIK